MKLVNNLVSKFNTLNKGNLINTALFTAWSLHEGFVISNYNIHTHSLFESTMHIMTLTWQYAGLFIISHDLHHAENPSVYEQFLGKLSLFCYGGFLLKTFSNKHNLHHKYPGIVGKDPDYDDENIVKWYLTFLSRYINIYQAIIQISIYNLAKYSGVSDENMIFFWLMPSLLASIQLFYYGTYLVHEENGIIKNSNLPDWLITFTSYNFGHHKEHHRNPKIPWYNLGKKTNSKKLK